MNLWGMKGDTLRKMENNLLRSLLIISLMLSCISCSLNKTSINIQANYLTLVSDRIDQHKSHIELRDAKKIVLDSSEFFLPQDDREIIARLNYTKAERI